MGGDFVGSSTADAESVCTIHVRAGPWDQSQRYFYALHGNDGHAEEVVGRAIAEKGGREQTIIATKVGLEWRGNTLFRIATRERISFKEIEDSLRHLQTDYIDLYQVHWPGLHLSLIEETAAAMLELKQQQGKIRAIRVSNYSVDEMERFREVAPLMPPHSRPIISSSAPPNALLDELRQQQRRGHAFCYEALCRGLLTGQINADTRTAT